MTMEIEEFMEKYTLIGDSGNFATENSTGKKVVFVTLSEPEQGLQVIDADVFEENRKKIQAGLADIKMTDTIEDIWIDELNTELLKSKQETVKDLEAMIVELNKLPEDIRCEEKPQAMLQKIHRLLEEVEKL